MIRADLSGRVTTEEALRAASQAFALADAGSITAILCDLRKLSRAPVGLEIVAAAVGARIEPSTRIAIVGRARQLPLIQRFAEGVGGGERVRAFVGPPQADGWLTRRTGSSRGTTTERRHAASLAPTETESEAAPLRRAAGPAA